MPSIHVGSGGEAAAKKGIRASAIATRTIRNDRTTEGPGLDRCRCKGGTDECKGNRSPPQVGPVQNQLADATLSGARSGRQVNRNSKSTLGWGHSGRRGGSPGKQGCPS